MPAFLLALARTESGMAKSAKTVPSYRRQRKSRRGFFGWLWRIIVALFLLRFVSRQQAVPYAPFLALAAVAVMLTQGPVFAPL